MSTVLHLIAYVLVLPIAAAAVVVFVVLVLSGVIKVEDYDETDFRRLDYST